MMIIYKKIILVSFVFLVLFLLSACGNRQIGPDTNQSFNRAWIKLGDAWYEMTIKAWRDFDNGDEIQIITENGDVYLTHYSNMVLMHK